MIEGEKKEGEVFTGAVFLIEVGKIKPNPFQPRREFDEDRLRDLADSIRRYGILQPLVVTRKEVDLGGSGLAVEYELIAGERRWRASQLAGLTAVPAIIKSEQSDKEKLELAIIENLQREDLNAIDRATAFKRLVEEFALKHVEVAKRVGRSREYVSNTIRLLMMPPEMVEALSSGQINEGHAKPILMLSDRPAEQKVLFQDIISRRLTVRDAEAIARRIAFERVRNKEKYLSDPGVVELEERLTETLGARVHINRRNVGGRVVLDFASNEELQTALMRLAASVGQAAPDVAQLSYAEDEKKKMGGNEEIPSAGLTAGEMAVINKVTDQAAVQAAASTDPDSDMYFIKNFSV